MKNSITMINGIAVKRSIPIKWFTWKDKIEDLEEWCKLLNVELKNNFEFKDNILKVYTLEGHSYPIPEGYIIIQGSAGEFYPHEPELFEGNYIKQKEFKKKQ